MRGTNTMQMVGGAVAGSVRGHGNQRIVDLVEFCRLTGIPIETMVRRINRKTFGEDNGLIIGPGELLVDMRVYELHDLKDRRGRKPKHG